MLGCGDIDGGEVVRMVKVRMATVKVPRVTVVLLMIMVLIMVSIVIMIMILTMMMEVVIVKAVADDIVCIVTPDSWIHPNAHQ